MAPLDVEGRAGARAGRRVNVGLYGRVSTEPQQERGTVTPQREALRAATSAEEHTVVEELVGGGYSGPRLDRPRLIVCATPPKWGCWTGCYVCAPAGSHATGPRRHPLLTRAT